MEWCCSRFGIGINWEVRFVVWGVAFSSTKTEEPNKTAPFFFGAGRVFQPKKNGTKQNGAFFLRGTWGSLVLKNGTTPKRRFPLLLLFLFRCRSFGARDFTQHSKPKNGRVWSNRGATHFPPPPPRAGRSTSTRTRALKPTKTPHQNPPKPTKKAR